MSDVFSYSNKRVVVTGGASGVGAALVELLDRLGEPEVIVLDVREPSVSSSQRWLTTDLTSPAPTDTWTSGLSRPIAQVDDGRASIAVGQVVCASVVFGHCSSIKRRISGAISASSGAMPRNPKWSAASRTCSSDSALTSSMLADDRVMWQQSGADHRHVSSPEARCLKSRDGESWGCAPRTD
jgi:hypothetical protein